LKVLVVKSAGINCMPNHSMNLSLSKLLIKRQARETADSINSKQYARALSYLKELTPSIGK